LVPVDGNLIRQMGTVRRKLADAGRADLQLRRIIKRFLFHFFKTRAEIFRLGVMMYTRFPLSLKNVEDLLHERGIDITHEIVRFWWKRSGPRVAAEIRKKRVGQMRASSNWKWHLDQVFVKINGEINYRWRVRGSRRGSPRKLCYKAP